MINRIYITTFFLFGILILSPILFSDYFGDDIYNFQVHGAVPAYYDSVYDLTVFYFKKWVFEQGRFFPGAFYAYYVFWLFDNVVSYKIFLVVCILINIIAFSYLVYMLTKNIKLVFLFSITVLLLFQFKYYHDSFLSFHGLIQLVFLYVTIALIFLIKFFEKKNKYYLVLSTLFYTFSLLTYEISFSFLLIFIIIIFVYSENLKTKIVNFIIFILPYVAIFSLNIYIRHIGVANEGAYSINFNFMTILKTYIFQISSTLPLSYIFKDVNVWLKLLFAFIFMLFLFISFKRISKNKDERVMYLIGFALIFLTPILITLSPKYQSEIRFGVGYIPVYIQYFGLGILIATFISSLNNLFYKNLGYLALIVIGIIHLKSNINVVKNVNDIIENKRKILAIALDKNKNIFNDNDNVCFNGENQIHSKEYLNIYVNKKLNVYSNLYDCDKNNGYKIEYNIDGNYSHIKIERKDFLSTILLKKDSFQWHEEKNYPNDLIPISYQGSHGLEFDGAKNFMWVEKELVIKIDNYANEKQLRINIRFLDDREVYITTDNEKFTITKNKNNLDINLNKGYNTIKIYSNKDAIRPEPRDPRSMSFGIDKPEIMDIK